MRKHVYIVFLGFLWPAIVFSQAATLSGTIFTSNLESDVRAGGKTINIQLTSARWAYDLGDEDNTSTNDLIKGFTGDQNWDKVTDALNYRHVTRVSNTLATITLPTVPDYYLSGDEAVSLTIPPSSLFLSFNSIPATPKIEIKNEAAKMLVSGAIADGTLDKEPDIRTSGSNIILDLEGDLWDTQVGTNSPITANLVRGISGSASWNTDVVNTILGTDRGASNVNRSGQSVTINIPAVANYDIIDDDNIVVSVPYQSLEYTASGTITGIPGLRVEAAKASLAINDPGLTEATLDGAELTLSLTEDSYKDNSLNKANFTNNGPGIISVESVAYIDKKTALAVLGLNGDLTADVSNFRLTIDAVELKGGRSLTSNAISISAGNNPVITNVSIPDGDYGIGDEITVLITVANDQGSSFTYHAGTVAGKVLDRFERVSATMYHGFFTVLATDPSYTPPAPIPVTGLQLADGPLLGNQYSSNITGDITIDTKIPVINYMQAPIGTKKVGDLVDIIVSADAAGYLAVESQTRVNNVPLSSPNVSFIELGNGVYILRYQVAEGDRDVTPGTLTASLQVMDQSGNLSLIKTSLTSNTTIIDANSPKITRITVPNGVFNIGDVIEVLIQADGPNYAATNDTYVNGVPLSSSSLSFSNVSGNQYRLLYTIRNVDPEVLPGEINISVYLRDPSGNIAPPYSVVEPNTLAIYTNLPSALLTGNYFVCEGDAAKLIVNLTGRSPWKIYLFDGDKTKEYSGITNSPYEVLVTPSILTTYRIDSVIDVNGTPNIGQGTAIVSVRERTPVEIINLNTTYSIASDPIKLEASVEGGTFSGPGVNSATGYFNPALADTVNSPHTILYTYLNANNCTSTDSALVFVLGATGDIFIPKEIYCNYNTPFTVTGSNIDGDTGTFTLVNESGNEVSGLTDNGNNTATVDPGVLTPGKYTVRYEYFHEINFVLKDDFSVESVEDPEILIPDQENYCQNIAPFTMESSVPEAIFSGPGVTGNVTHGFIFNPGTAKIGSNIIVLSNSSAGGCYRADTMTINIGQIPKMNFISENLCVGPTDTVFFTNTTLNSNIITEWNWNFGDPKSGEKNFSSEKSPYHLFSEAGPRNIQLVGTAESGCTDTLRRTLDFGNTPSGSFRWNNECFEDGASVTFTSEMTSVSPIVSYGWAVIDPAGDTTTVTGKKSFTRDFDAMDTYTIELNTESAAGCKGYAKRELVLKPVITPSDEVNYLENFTSGTGWWSAEASPASDYLSWKYGPVSFANTGNPASRGWFTNLSEIPIVESSWVKSPCFNLSNLEKPMITIDIYRSLAKNTEGVVLQATANGGLNWKTIGVKESGIEWYNTSTLVPGPAAQSFGWTGNQPFAADLGWKESRHDLDDVLGEALVQFRIAFASDHKSTEPAREGFAFDNIRIGERKRKILLEHFTNTSANNTRETDGMVNGLYNWFFNDMVKLEYHTSFPGMDPFNTHNTTVPALRGLYYGVSSVPFSVFNGGYEDNLLYSYDPDTLKVNDARIERLKDEIFKIDIQTVSQSNKVTADISLTALKDLGPAERIIHVAVYEKLITNIGTVNGAVNFLNVVKTMLPNVAGTAVFDGWTAGQERSWQFSWDFANVYRPDMVRVAAFIQNDETREVYQAEAFDKTNLTTGLYNNELINNGIRVYPNPASDFLYVLIEAGEDSDNYRMEFFDQLGRIVHQETIHGHEKLKQIRLEHLSKGIYYIRIMDSNNQPVKASKIVIMK